MNNPALIEELQFAFGELKSVPTQLKDQVESLTGLSFNAIADYTDRAAEALKSQAAEIERLRGENARLRLKLGHPPSPDRPVDRSGPRRDWG